jgi:hypothetical protein
LVGEEVAGAVAGVPVVVNVPRVVVALAELVIVEPEIAVLTVAAELVLGDADRERNIAAVHAGVVLQNVPLGRVAPARQSPPNFGLLRHLPKLIVISAELTVPLRPFGVSSLLALGKTAFLGSGPGVASTAEAFIGRIR